MNTEVNTPEVTAVEPLVYGHSDHSEAEYERLLSAAIAAGVVEPDARPSKLVYSNRQWQITA